MSGSEVIFFYCVDDFLKLCARIHKHFQYKERFLEFCCGLLEHELSLVARCSREVKVVS